MAKQRRTTEEIKRLRETVLKGTKKDFISGPPKKKKEAGDNTSFGKNTYGKSTYGKS